MRGYIITKNDFSLWVNDLIKINHTAGVKRKADGKFYFDILNAASELCIDYDVTLLPPKKYLQPQRETILKFSTSPKVKAEGVAESELLTIIGVHPYDMVAINQMDKIFEETNKDANYLKRRSLTTIIGIDPVSASTWAFWSSMGTHTVNKGYDLWLTYMGDKYFMEAATAKGEKLLKLAKTVHATKKDEAERQKIREKLPQMCTKKITAKNIYDLIKSNYDHPIWESRAKACYSCGSCNFVCPTCYCFDVREEIDLDLKTGRRTRLWDACQLEEFAKIGSGENFREERLERFRHRAFRKLVYMVDKIGEMACVGCGRCSSVCLPDISDLAKIINELA